MELVILVREKELRKGGGFGKKGSSNERERENKEGERERQGVRRTYHFIHSSNQYIFVQVPALRFFSLLTFFLLTRIKIVNNKLNLLVSMAVLEERD